MMQSYSQASKKVAKSANQDKGQQKLIKAPYLAHL